MAGSDRVPDPNDQKRARIGKRKPPIRAKWRSSMSAYRSVRENVLDTADIVRDGDFATTIARAFATDIAIAVDLPPSDRLAHTRARS
jgi:hypothetical protein